MSHHSSIFRLVRHPLEVRTARVERTELVTPRMKRVTLRGPELLGFRTLSPEDHVKLFFPARGAEVPVLPTLGPLGLVLPSIGRDKPISRDYTPRSYDPASLELTIDFYLHGQGVASAWAAGTSPGQVLGVAGPRGSYVAMRPFDWQLLVGDETALPEQIRRLEELPPGTRAFAVFLVDDSGEEQPISTRADLTLRWVHRRGEDAGAALVRAVGELALPGAEGLAFVAGEASEVRAVYAHLVRERNFPQQHVVASGHWKRGVVNHDHHEAVTP